MTRSPARVHGVPASRSIEKGRRGVVKLVCRVLCLEGASVAAGRALLIPTAIMHQASRIEATINKKDEGQREFWLGLGFEIHDDIAEICVDLGAMCARAARGSLCARTHAARALSRAPAVPRPATRQHCSRRGALALDVRRSRAGTQPAPAAPPPAHEAPRQPQQGKAKKQRRQAADAEVAGSPQRPRQPPPPPSRGVGHEGRAAPPPAAAQRFEPSLIGGDEPIGAGAPEVLPLGLPGDSDGGLLEQTLVEPEEAAEVPTDVYIRKSVRALPAAQPRVIGIAPPSHANASPPSQRPRCTPMSRATNAASPLRARVRGPLRLCVCPPPRALAAARSHRALTLARLACPSPCSAQVPPRPICFAYRKGWCRPWPRRGTWCPRVSSRCVRSPWPRGGGGNK